MIILGVKSFILSLLENVLSRSRFIPGRDLVQRAGSQAMRAISGGWQLPNLQAMEVMKRNNE
jgi:hypothetical protein